MRLGWDYAQLDCIGIRCGGSAAPQGCMNGIASGVIILS